MTRVATRIAAATTLAGFLAACAPMADPGPNIVETAGSDGRFGTLVAAIEAADLAETLSTGGPFTVFAPTDEAFAALPEGAVEGLLDDPEALQEVLTYHVVPGEITSDQLAGARLDVATVQGSEVHIDARDGVRVNDATVTQADIAAANGVIHVIDTVLMPQ